MKACLLLFFYFSLIGQLHGADVKIKENESVMGSTAMTYDLSEEKLMKLKYKSQHGDSEASFRLYQYYCFTKNNIDKQLRFLERSASQGNVTAQFNYGVFLSDKSADIYNQKTLRSMQGSHFHLPIYRGPILDMVEACRKQGIPVLATTLSDVSVDYKAVKTDGNFALVMGNEGQGISQEMAESADQLVHISMPGQAESLNVAVAAGILMFSL